MRRLTIPSFLRNYPSCSSSSSSCCVTKTNLSYLNCFGSFPSSAACSVTSYRSLFSSSSSNFVSSSSSAAASTTSNETPPQQQQQQLSKKQKKLAAKLASKKQKVEKQQEKQTQLEKEAEGEEEANHNIEYHYPSFITSTTAKQFLENNSFEETTETTTNAKIEPSVIGGRVISVRDMGKVLFISLKSNGDIIQVVYEASKNNNNNNTNSPSSENQQQETSTTKEKEENKQETSSNNNLISKADVKNIARTVKSGDVIGIVGIPGTTRSGEHSIFASKIEVLAKYRVAAQDISPPDLTGHVAPSDPEILYRYRFVDLMCNSKTQEMFRMRAKVIRAIRNFLDERDFIEVETPVFQTVPSGAAARPFRTRHEANETDLFLRVAPELYLKQCVVGGLDRVYEIGRVFRNEGSDRSHNPEFTSCEFYQAFATYRELMPMTEELIRSCCKEALNGKLQFDLPHSNSSNSIQNSNSNSSNTNNDNNNVDESNSSSKKSHKETTSTPSSSSVNNSKQSKKEIKEELKQHSHGLGVDNIDNKIPSLKSLEEKQEKQEKAEEGEQEEEKSSQTTETTTTSSSQQQQQQQSVEKITTIDLSQPFRVIDIIPQLESHIGLQFPKPISHLDSTEGVEFLSRILQLHDIPMPTPASPSKLFDKLIDHFITDRIIQPTFVIGHPTFMSPLAKEDSDSKEREGISERFELFINGMEICNSYSELNDPVEQKQRFEQQLKQRIFFNDDEAQCVDETFLKALQVGLPPTAGWGLGIDRLVMLLAGSTTIRDVILFPLLRQKATDQRDIKRQRSSAALYDFCPYMAKFCLNSLEAEFLRRGGANGAHQLVRAVRHALDEISNPVADSTSNSSNSSSNSSSSCSPSSNSYSSALQEVDDAFMNFSNEVQHHQQQKHSEIVSHESTHHGNSVLFMKQTTSGKECDQDCSLLALVLLTGLRGSDVVVRNKSERMYLDLVFKTLCDPTVAANWWWRR